jgi:hypothetical protein
MRWARSVRDTATKAKEPKELEMFAFVLAALVTFGLSSTPVQAQTDNSQSSASQGNEAAGQSLEEVVVWLRSDKNASKMYQYPCRWSQPPHSGITTK